MFEIDNIIAQRNEAFVARRFGRIYYTKQLLEIGSEAIQKIYAKLIPMEVKYDLSRDLFEVVAMCDEFEPVEETHAVPQYQVTIKVHMRKKGAKKAYYISFTKVDE